MSTLEVRALDALTDAIAQMGRKIEARDARIGEANQNNNHEDEFVNRNHGPIEGSGEPNGSMQNGGLQTRFSCLNFPSFNGEDPTGWIYKAKQFFLYQKIDEAEKVLLASFHL